jgi:bifunctional non-homologous end joining protein LigD
MRVHQRRDLVIGGYTPGGRNFDAILVGYYKGRSWIFVGKVRAGFTPALRASVFKEFQGLETDRCPFKNLPEARRGQRGEGLTAAEMAKCRWLRPRRSRRSISWERTARESLAAPNVFGAAKPRLRKDTGF